MMTHKPLKIQVCPKKCKGINLHSEKYIIIPFELWMSISSKVRASQNYTCQYCGMVQLKGALAEMSKMVAHEVWFFDDESHVQRLVDIVCACTRCHTTIHHENTIARSSREYFLSKAHYMEVNFCEEQVFEKDLDQALAEYRRLNQIDENRRNSNKSDGWLLDISYAIEQGYLSYSDINIDILDKIAFGSSMLLDKYKAKARLAFNEIPRRCLIDKADGINSVPETELCQICGNSTSKIHIYYDLRIKESQPEIFLAAKWRICPLCRDTIYNGTRKWLKKYRKTTKHYMSVNQCNYDSFLADVRKNRSALERNEQTPLRIYMKSAYAGASSFPIKKNDEQNNPRLDKNRGQYYIFPNNNLKSYLPFLKITSQQLVTDERLRDRKSAGEWKYNKSDPRKRD